MHMECTIIRGKPMRHVMNVHLLKEYLFLSFWDFEKDGVLIGNGSLGLGLVDTVLRCGNRQESQFPCF
jgi:hypothetical protein